MGVTKVRFPIILSDHTLHLLYICITSKCKPEQNDIKLHIDLGLHIKSFFLCCLPLFTEYPSGRARNREIQA